MAFETYKRYKIDQDKYDEIHRGLRGNFLSVTLGRSEFEAEKEKLRTKAADSKKEFAESSKFIGTLLISVVTLAATVLWARIDHLADVKTISKQATQIDSLRAQNSHDEAQIEGLGLQLLDQKVQIELLKSQGKVGP